MDGIVNLSPEDPRAKEAIISLLGTTLAELKQIDKAVVGSSKNIAAVKTDLKNVLNFQQAPVVAPPVITPPIATTVAAGINIQQSQHTPAQIQPQSQSVPVEDPNQLVFDFNQKITPDTINNKLDRILDKLDNIISAIKN